MQLDDPARVIAAAFDLGRPLTGLEPVPGGRSHQLWRLRTDRGSWAVKQFNRSREQWWADAFAVATRVEVAAYRAGLSMPRPVPPSTITHPPVGTDSPVGADLSVDPGRPGDLLADVDLGGVLVSVVVHEWCPGTPLPAVDVPPAVLDWVGRTLAALHALPLPAPAGPGATLHDPDEWRDWLDHPPAGNDASFVQAVRGHLPDVDQAIRLATGAWSRLEPALEPVLSHCDVKPDNVLLGTGGPVLVDWEGAAGELAQWEAARAAVTFSRTADGWSREAFRQVLDSYRTAGGHPVPRDPAVFGGLVRRQVNAAAFLLWRALGHRPVGSSQRAAAHEHTLEQLADLRLSLDRIERWTAWLPAA